MIAAVVGSLPAAASATTTDWGVHDALETAAPLTPVGSFEDTYLFTLPDTLNLSSTTVANNLTDVLGIADGMVQLFKEAGAVDTLLGAYSFDGTTGSTSHTFSALSSGSYYYLVSGIGTGSTGGFYSISSTISPIPEPATYAYLLGGLGIAGMLMRRRSSA
jgi:hypothetical protein